MRFNSEEGKLGSKPVTGHVPLKVPNVKFDFGVSVHHIHRMNQCEKPNSE